jgi:hypothetical protein
MNLTDKVILEWSYKTSKGYPDINSQEDIALFESMFGFNLLEKKGDNEAKAIQKIVSKFPAKYSTMSNPIRIANTEKVDSEEFVKDIKSVFGNINVKAVPPKQAPNPSSKFTSFVFDTQDETVNIVLAGGMNANKGNKFESVVANDLQFFKDGGTEYTHQALVEEMIKEFNLTPTNFEVREEGGNNQKRSLKFTPEGPLVSTPNNQSIAETLTDLTLVKDGNPIYISLKFGNQLTFFNSGTKSIFTDEQVASGKVTTPEGVSLLEMLGIDNELFCRVFNEYREDGTGTNFKSEHKEGTPDQEKLNNLMISGIGYNYYMLKGSDSGKYDFFLIDEKYAKDAAKPTSGVLIEYGGAGGVAKRVNVKFSTGKYRMTVNIRNKQGGIAPTHLMADYKPI